ncbi:MAG: hypothetical protein F6K35_39075 [Okeania sp. SIO2H7]|nr:hypothetical protein [Okeania sp. SIO2H7]
MERQDLYEKLKTLNWQQKLGNLASTLATISTRSPISKYDKLTSHLLLEAALIIEWCAAEVPEDFLWELATMQRELMEWKKVFPVEEVRNLLALIARMRSDRILQMAGMLSEGDN